MSRAYLDTTALTEPILRAEPDNPIAMALHANSLRLRSIEFRDDQVARSRDLRQEAADLVDQALKLAPQSDVVRGLWAVNREFDASPAKIDEILADVTATAGLPDILYWSYGAILRRTGRIIDALGVHERLVRNNPDNASALTRLGWLYLIQGDLIQSERFFARAERINENLPELIARRRQSALWLGDDKALRALLADWPTVETSDTSELEQHFKLFAQERLSDTPSSDRLINSVRNPESIWLARMLVGVGDVDKAYALLQDHDWATGHPGDTIHLFYPDMEPFRADPRFWPLMKKIGLYDYWEQTGEWPDICLLEDHPGQCPTL